MRDVEENGEKKQGRKWKMMESRFLECGGIKKQI